MSGRRPGVDVVVPFVGDESALKRLGQRLNRLRLCSEDSVLVVDNTPGRSAATVGQVRVLHAAGRRTPGFARNQGAARGSAEWLLFLDADTTPQPDLLDRYFDPPPDSRTALIAGGVSDEAVAVDAPPANRYAYLAGAMSQDDSFRFGSWSYPKSANVACRREAFEAVGGFREDIRAAEDADLTYRLKAVGWGVERRESAHVVHFSRPTIAGLLKQKALWGAGGAWLDRTYPGAVAPRPRLRIVGWATKTIVRGLIARALSRDRDAALRASVMPLETLAFEFGRSLPNERPLTVRLWLRAVRQLVAVRERDGTLPPA